MFVIYILEELNFNCIVCIVIGEGLGENINIYNYVCIYIVMLNNFVENFEVILLWLGVSRKCSCSKKLRFRKNGRICF